MMHFHEDFRYLPPPVTILQHPVSECKARKAVISVDGEEGEGLEDP
jgi:hypothetical protein